MVCPNAKKKSDHQPDSICCPVRQLVRLFHLASYKVLATILTSTIVRDYPGPKNRDNLKNEDDIKDEGLLKNEDDLKNEDNLKKEDNLKNEDNQRNENKTRPNGAKLG